MTISLDERPLSGVKALDLTAGVCGSFAVKLLADYGADVVKVEPPAGGYERNLGPSMGESGGVGHNGLFYYLNSNKRSVTLDISDERGRHVLEQLLESVEIVVLGDEFQRVAPVLQSSAVLGRAKELGKIVTAVTAYGLTGPYRERGAEELNLFGLGGPMKATGVPEREPMMYPEYVALLQAGAAAALATVMAFYGKALSGRGATVDCAISETLLGTWDRRAYSLQAYQYSGEQPAGRMRTHAMAFGSYACKDGFVTLAAQGARFPRLLTLIGREDLAEDPRFSGFSATFNSANFAAFEEILAAWLKNFTRREVFLRGQAIGVLVSPVLNPSECLTDEHLSERGFWMDMKDGEHAYTLPGPPVVLHGAATQPPRPAPHLGEHTVEVLHGDLGISTELLAELQGSGVL